MAVAAVDAVDFDARTIRAHHELQDSNFALDDFHHLEEIYQDQGYLLFREALDRASVNRALRRMMSVMARYGVVAEGATEPLWAGRPSPPGMEESPEFAGICRELVEDPANLAVLEKILGERPSSVPIVQYRYYSPGTPISIVHQDGFYSPGIHGFRPVWMPLTRIDVEMGSLVLALGQHKRGLIHNTAKPPIFPIPADQIPEDCWATTTFDPGDLLIIHPHVPHVGLANVSNRVRFSIDSRIQSAANPCVLLGDIVATTPDTVTLRTASGDRTLTVTDTTYIRTSENRGARIPKSGFQAEAPAGLRVVAAIEGDAVTMIRRASEA